MQFGPVSSRIIKISRSSLMWSLAVAVHLLLPSPALSWWCETSARTGCRGHPRHLVLDGSDVVDMFEVFEKSPVPPSHQVLAVDWDNDGDLDLVTLNIGSVSQFNLFEQGNDNSFVKKEPGPLQNVDGTLCLPAVVDINGDSLPDVVVSDGLEVRYYERDLGGLVEKRGHENPFRSIAGMGGACGHLSIADWDNDGHMDLLFSDFVFPMRHFRESGGTFHLETASPFAQMQNHSLFRKPLFVDWNNDGRMDLLLAEQPLRRGLFGSMVSNMTGGGIPLPEGNSGCEVLIFLQDDAGNFYESSEPKGVLGNKDCRYMNWLFFDVDGDKDLDVMLATRSAMGVGQTWYLGENTGGNNSLSLRNETQAASFPLSKIKLLDQDPLTSGKQRFYCPYLLDFDLDGHLDLVLISCMPIFATSVPTRFFQHNADHSVSELADPPNISCPLNWSLPVSSTDFDGDGLVDLIGLIWPSDPGFEVLVCLQGPDGYALMDQQKNPFYPTFDAAGIPRTCFLPMKSIFLDWDGDGDVDQLCLDTETRLLFVEQVSNGTVGPRPLPLPPADDFVASDFDGDGDVDLVLSVTGLEGWKYYERTEDGNLLELLEHENPFHRSVWHSVLGTLTGFNPYGSSALGDWNHDGALDLVVVDRMKVSLLWNKPFPAFIEYDREQNPFSEIHLKEFTFADWNLVDVDDDGYLDLVLERTGGETVTHAYFQQTEEGDLRKVDDNANPLRSAPPHWTFRPSVSSVSDLNWNDMKLFGKRHMVADVDGDGDVDIIEATSKGLEYAEQRNGSFIVLKGKDNPFWQGFLASGLEDAKNDCSTFVDFDGDGDLDLVKTKPTVPGVAFSPPEVLYYEQASPRWNSQQSNFSFHRRYGKDNPFWSVDLAAILDNSESSLGLLCPAVVDMDEDGELDLVLVPETADRFLYFKQQNGTFKLAKEKPFAHISVTNPSGRLKFQFADFNGDGIVDLVASKGPSLQYFTKGVCFGSSACHPSASCNKKNRGKATCTCPSGSNSPECRICNDYHTRKDSICRSCPGFGSVSGTCTFRGVCDDDVDARNRQAEQNISGFALEAATGTGLCTCSAHFHGENCELGECPPGHRLERNARVAQATDKYPHWEACEPCQTGRYKSSFGNKECDLCREGLVPDANRSSCVECPAGHVPRNFSICSLCSPGSVASPGDSRCTPCPAGTAPGPDNGTCVRCGDGKVANPLSASCSQCSAGSVPDSSRTSCLKCSGQSYAYEGDEECRICSPPAMVWVENECTLLWFFLILLLGIILVLLVASIFGRCRLICFKRRLKQMVEDKKWRELYATRTSRLEYGIWHGAAEAALKGQKENVKSRSMQLGISLRYVFEELQATYEERANQAEWRLDTFGPATRSSFLVRIRNMQQNVPDTDAAWNALQICDYPEDPNFHQVASLLAYGPLALGKGQCCPRDGKMDCSIVDALQATEQSGPATWFLSWVWGYKFSTMSQALSRWWQRHQRVSGDASGKVFIWWCVMVNNQFRMLEKGDTVDATNLFDVFGRQLAGIGKMLMCLDKMKEGNYTTRIWCIFEVFVASKNSIPTTVILPELEGLDGIETLKELTEHCRVDAQSAEASVPQDAIDIKRRIMDDQGSFEFVNQTVEKELWAEVIKFMKEQEATPAAAQAEAVRPSSSTDQPGTMQVSEGSDKSLMEKGVRWASLEKCHIQ